MKLGLFNQTTSDTAESIFPTLESIAFQKDHPAGSELEATIIEYMNLVKNGMSAREIDSQKELKDRFTDILKKNFGISVQLYCNGLTAAVFTNVYVPHNALIREAVKDYFQIRQHTAGQGVLKFSGIFKDLGYVNTRTARIGGWFSEQISPLYINFNKLMQESLTSAELTAIVLHEVGHIFNAVAMTSRVSKTNQIIADVVRYVSRKNPEENVNYVYNELSKIDDELSRDTVEGLMSGNAVVMGISAFRVAQGSLRSLSNSSIYNDTSSEALADSFATRMGYGSAFVTGLHKSQLLNVTGDVFDEVLYLFSYIMAIIVVSQILIIVAAGSVSYGIVFGLFSGLGTIMRMSSNERITNADYAYDNTVDRFLRIKRNLVGLLKDSDVDNKVKRDVLEQLSVIDSAISKSYDVPRPIRDIMKILFVSDRRAQVSIDAQQQIEKLLANDIFIASAKLATSKT